MSNNIAVVIPTYNEKENILNIVEAVNSLGLPLEIIIVDDNSPDGTGRIAEEIKKKKANIHVIHRSKKAGLGPAYIAAFNYLLKKDRYDYIIQMDADFSHNPRDIPKLLKAARQYDVAVGSRYIKKGGVSNRWNLLRKLISKGGNIYARTITGLGIKDCTSGFKCYRKKALASINLESIFLNGYGFQIQMVYELNKKGLSITEVPIFFDERTRGISKMNSHIVIEALFSLILMRLKDRLFKQ